MLDSRLTDLENPRLDFTAGESPEKLLCKLQTQNFALDRLRSALDYEDQAVAPDHAAVG